MSGWEEASLRIRAGKETFLKQKVKHQCNLEEVEDVWITVTIKYFLAEAHQLILMGGERMMDV